MLWSSLHRTRNVGFGRRLRCLAFQTERGGSFRTRFSSSSSSSTSSGSKSTTIIEESGSNSNIDFGLSLHFWRLACAFGMVYVTTEYGIELTICEGPSMFPTINSYGEIILIDRFTPRLYGIQGGPNGAKRANLAREKQRHHEKLIRSIETVVSLENMTWHEPIIPTNELLATGAWERLWNNTRTPVSVGDVVVVQHPDRVGTVCKRVLGLPGDVVTKPRNRDRRKDKLRLRRRRTGMVKIPDGHIWVEGDNPWNSSDSRNYGPIPASLIVGRVVLRVWPLGKPLIERGARPERPPSEVPQMSLSGSVVLPAGYENQIIKRDCNQ